MLKVFPTLIAGGVGVAHGVAADSDVANGRANPDGTAIAGHYPMATIIEVGSLVGGVGLDIMRFSPDISESLILAGAALLGHRGGKMLGHMTPPAPMLAAPYWASGHFAAPDLQLQRSSESWLGY
jgi:hypothetical protein